MALPAGAATATITVGVSTDIAGEAGTISALTVVPEQRLVWAATGAAVETTEADGTARSVTILADQPGVLASSTVAGQPVLVEVREWALVARWTVTIGGKIRRHMRRFAAPASGSIVALDLLPERGQHVPGPVAMAQALHFGLAAITDNGDGTLDLSGTLVTDNLDGTLTIGA